jgi:hypothetical protein
MNIMSLGAKFYQASPTGVIIAGAALTLALPPVRRGIRAAAIMTTRGLYQAGNSMSELGSKVKDGFVNIVTEAKQSDQQAVNDLSKERVHNLREKSRFHRRRFAVATASGVLAVANKAKKLRGELQSIIDEARVSQKMLDQQPEQSH